MDARFASLPALTKRDIRENFPQGMLPSGLDINTGLDSGEIALVNTSGTTDDKITNIWNQSWWNASEKASWKLNSDLLKASTGGHREAILVNPKNVGFISDEVDLPMQKRCLSRFLYLNEKTDPLSWTQDHLERMVEELNTFQPAVLEANPSYLARLCRYITKQKKTAFQPGVIVFTYEYPTRFACRQIRQVFSCPMISSYGTTETGYVFMQCEKGKFHQNSEFCRVDLQHFKTEFGGPLLNRILVTPFQNPWCYFLRFDTGDVGYLEESGRCDCGRRDGLILSAIGGRKANLTLTCQGRPVTLFELDNAISILENIEMYKLVQTDTSTYELHLVSQQPNRDELGWQASGILRQLYGREAKINLIYDKDIAPEGSGKYLVSRANFDIKIEKYLDLSPRRA